MVAWWWVLVALVAGATLGLVALALCLASQAPYPDERLRPPDRW